MDPGQCLICGDNLDCGEVVNVSAGLSTLIAASVQRKDALAKKLDGLSAVQLHKVCRKNYTRKSSILASQKIPSVSVTSENDSEPFLLRSSVDSFDFKRHCFFCGEEAVTNEKTREEYKKKVREVQTFEIKDAVLNRCLQRKDDWGDIVHTRITAAHDLVASEARYHRDCYVKFLKDGVEKSVGRPSNEKLQRAFEKLCVYLNDSDDCQHLVSDLVALVNKDLGFSYRYLKDFIRFNLHEKFGDRIFFFSRKRDLYLILADSSSKLKDQMYLSRDNYENDEQKMEILQAAANIIRKEILFFPYEKDIYPTSDVIRDGGRNLIPEKLFFFVSQLTQRKNKARDVMVDIVRKRTNICHAIIAACRPRTFLSPIHCALGLYLSRCFISRHLIELLSNLGVCISYHEVELYLTALVNAGRPQFAPEAFSQYVFDNADINVRTIDGHDTFHALGGIEVITPSKSLIHNPKIPRVASTKFEGAFNIPIHQYPHDNQKLGLKKFSFSDLASELGFKKDENESSPNIMKLISLDPLNLLWLSGVSDGELDENNFSGWHGFMHSIFRSSKSEEFEYQTSYILALPSINLDPANLTSIFSALTFASQQAKKAGKSCALVTFDQPLYVKAMKIIADDDDLSNVQIRLGGFHLLLSFLGCMGKFMEGSGIEELWGTVYGKATIKHLISGHAYARSYRAHMLTQSALIAILCEEFPEIKSILEKISALKKNLIDKKLSIDEAIASDTVKEAAEKFSDVTSDLSRGNRTAKLWLQEIALVDLVFLFIRAERSGDWQLHLNTVKEMLPYFNAAGHFNYAKSAQLYLQQMTELEKKLSPAEFENFTQKGFFTVSRNEKFFTGTWSDMCIEQSLMRSLKSVGGLTHGRGLSERTLAKYILCAPEFLQINESLQHFAGVSSASSEQHVELRDSRIKRDQFDRLKFLSWLKLHSPFKQESDDLVCIATGLVASKDINCDDAFRVGLKLMGNSTGKNFEEVTLPRKLAVKPIVMAKTGVIIKSDVVSINPDQLFNRVICLAKGTEEFKTYFKYELSPYPTSMFVNNIMMRKSKKSRFMSLFSSGVIENKQFNEKIRHVIDGGYFLNSVVWPKLATYRDIVKMYVSCALKRYTEHSSFVFDGYPAYSTTKGQEQLRRAKKTSATINFSLEMQCTKTQAEFLSNSQNKKKLITAVGEELKKVGVEVFIAEADADRDIVSTAILKAERGETVVMVGTDTDLMVIMLTLVKGRKLQIFFKIPGTSKNPATLYDITKLVDDFKQTSSLLLFAYAMTGCDTTSALFRTSKIKAYNLLVNDSSLQKDVLIFNESNVDKEIIGTVGEKYLIHFYGGANLTQTLDECRFIMYSRKVAKMSLKSKFEMASLPPTSSAARQHSLRVYYQIQVWLGNSSLDPREWGWKEEEGSDGRKFLLPVHSTLNFAPDDVIQMTFCNCKSGCGTNCKCFKKGLCCSAMCRNCSGVTCKNILSAVEEFEEDHL